MGVSISLEDFQIFITSTLRKKNIHSNTHILSDLGCESVDIVTLIVAVEEKYDVKIEEGDIQDILIVNKLYNYVNNQIK